MTYQTYHLNQQDTADPDAPKLKPRLLRGVVFNAETQALISESK